MLVKQHFYEIAEKDSMMDSYINENASQNRIPIATQNSCHDQLFEFGLPLEDEGSC